MNKFILFCVFSFLSLSFPAAAQGVDVDFKKTADTIAAGKTPSENFIKKVVEPKKDEIVNANDSVVTPRPKAVFKEPPPGMFPEIKPSPEELCEKYKDLQAYIKEEIEKAEDKESDEYKELLKVKEMLDKNNLCAPEKLAQNTEKETVKRKAKKTIKKK
ncbi:hypothetical protein Dip510_001809 [Elusimicrobium posterum]|uniref:hypothetical protein n=1 Tax=Elusimicrobium posterum TaxID=3116653 RepID=UPI003C72D90F